MTSIVNLNNTGNDVICAHRSSFLQQYKKAACNIAFNTKANPNMPGEVINRNINDNIIKDNHEV